MAPAIADLRHEHDLAVEAGQTLRAAWLRVRGSLALFRALALQAVLSAGAPVAADEAPSAARRYGSMALCVALSSVALSCILFQDATRSSTWVATMPGLWPWLLPALLPVSLPASVLAGTAVGVLHLDRKGVRPVPTLARPILLVSAAMALVTFLLYGWLTPRTNQVYREKVYHAITLAPPNLVLSKGDLERTLPELAGMVARLPAERTAGVRLELHKKLAIPALCLAYGSLAVALFGRLRLRQPAVTVASVWTGWALWVGPQLLVERWPVRDEISPALAGWSGTMVLAVVTAILWAAGARRQEGDGEVHSSGDDQAGACSSARSSR